MLIYSQLRGKSPVKRVFSLWTEVSRKKTLIQPIPRMSLARKKERKEPDIKPHQTGKLYVFKKEREKLKEFCFIFSKLVNELCYMLQSGDLDIFSQVKEKERKKKEKEEKDCWETFMFDTSRWLNIAGILKRKEKRKRNCFLNLIIICLVVAY